MQYLGVSVIDPKITERHYNRIVQLGSATMLTEYKDSVIALLDANHITYTIDNEPQLTQFNTTHIVRTH